MEENYSTIKKVTTSNEDWIAIYVNGKLKYEDFTIKNCEWFELGQDNPDIDFFDIEEFTIDSQAMEDEEFDEFPEWFSDIPEDLFI
jgi:hypothetical protein